MMGLEDGWVVVVVVSKEEEEVVVVPEGGRGAKDCWSWTRTFRAGWPRDVSRMWQVMGAFSGVVMVLDCFLNWIE